MSYTKATELDFRNDTSHVPGHYLHKQDDTGQIQFTSQLENVDEKYVLLFYRVAEGQSKCRQVYQWYGLTLS